MIYKISKMLAKIICREEILKPCYLEDCIYGFEITISNVINFMIVFLLGICTGKSLEMTVFYCVFVSLRIFCGGYHANTHKKCCFLFAVTAVIYLIMLKIVLVYVSDKMILFSLVALILATYIYVNAPVEHPNKPLAIQKIRIFKIKGIFIYVVWTVLGVVLWMEHIENLYSGITCTFIIITYYMIIGRRAENEKESIDFIGKGGYECGKES